jgi:hypothetical protein
MRVSGMEVRVMGLRRRTLLALLHTADGVLELLDVSLDTDSSSGHVIGVRDALDVGGFHI